MPKKENQKTKLLWILKILWEQTDDEHGLTTCELIDELDNVGISVTRQCLYEDINTLTDFGISIDKRRNGHSSTYHYVDREFQLPELKLLVDAVQSSHFLTEKKSRELINKLSSQTSRHEANSLKRKLYITDRYRADNEQIYYAVDCIYTAMDKNRRITFFYFEYNVKKEKTYRHDKKVYSVSPWGLSWSDGNYYMIAYDSEACHMKNYRVDKMENVRMTDTARDGRTEGENLDIAGYTKEMFNMLHGDDTLVTLRVENSRAGIIIDRFGDGYTFFPDGDNHFTVSVNVCVSPQFLGWIMSFGKQITITSPQNVVSAYKELAKEILEC